MALSIDHLTRIISFPQADLTLISGVLYEMDVNAFRLELNDYADSPAGMALPDTHVHATQVVLSGVTYARFFELINGFKIEIEDGQYTVQFVNANHNLADARIQNQVSYVIGNSAGLIVVGGGGPGDYINVNVKEVNDKTIIGDGQPGTEFGTAP